MFLFSFLLAQLRADAELDLEILGMGAHDEQGLSVLHNSRFTYSVTHIVCHAYMHIHIIVTYIMSLYE